MIKMKWMKNGLIATAMTVIVFCVTSCGTLLYPERKGQISGRIDPEVAILDAIGLLFFFIPGVIAFAVDFSNGTIYLPHTRASLKDGPSDLAAMEAIKVGKQALTKSNIELLVKEHTGKNIDLDSPNVKVTRMDGKEM